MIEFVVQLYFQEGIDLRWFSRIFFILILWLDLYVSILRVGLYQGLEMKFSFILYRMFYLGLRENLVCFNFVFIFNFIIIISFHFVLDLDMAEPVEQFVCYLLFSYYNLFLIYIRLDICYF